MLFRTKLANSHNNHGVNGLTDSSPSIVLMRYNYFSSYMWS